MQGREGISNYFYTSTHKMGARDYSMVMKIVLCGDKSVGKTTLIQRLSLSSFHSSQMNTIGVDFSIIDTVHQEGSHAGTITKTQIFDVNTSKRFLPNRQIIYEGLHVALLIYDVTVPETLDHIVTWLQEIQEIAGIIPVVLIANKIDLREKVPNSVTSAQGFAFAKRIKEEFLNDAFVVPFVEMSAKTGKVMPSGGVLIKLPKYETSFYLFH